MFYQIYTGFKSNLKSESKELYKIGPEMCAISGSTGQAGVQGHPPQQRLPCQPGLQDFLQNKQNNHKLKTTGLFRFFF